MLGCTIYILLSGVVCIATYEVCCKIMHEKVRSLGYVSLVKKKQRTFKEIIQDFTPIWSNIKTIFSISSVVEIISLRDEDIKNALDKNANFAKIDSNNKSEEQRTAKGKDISLENNAKKIVINEAVTDTRLDSSLSDAKKKEPLATTSENDPFVETDSNSIERGKVKSKVLRPNINKK